MTDERFDNLTKLVSRSTSRRGLLKGAAAVALSGVVARVRSGGSQNAEARARIKMACARLGQPCDTIPGTPGNQICCPHLTCNAGKTCCKPENETCLADGDCCGDNVCRPNPSGLGNRCLPAGEIGALCIAGADCAAGLLCLEVAGSTTGVCCTTEGSLCGDHCCPDANSFCCDSPEGPTCCNAGGFCCGAPGGQACCSDIPTITCCPAPLTGAGVCCAESETCVDGACCPSPCGSGLCCDPATQECCGGLACCNAGEACCGAPGQQTCCDAAGFCCGDVCCASIDDTCCPDPYTGTNTCCPSGQGCVNGACVGF